MTREEAIKLIEALKNGLHETGKDFPYRDEIIPLAKVALDMAIKALEQEPCDDCISRQSVIDALNKTSGIRGDALKALYELPPVTPKPKMGRWIEHFDESGKWYECDQCHIDWGGPVNYCPNCGAKMESEDK